VPYEPSGVDRSRITVVAIATVGMRPADPSRQLGRARADGSLLRTPPSSFPKDRLAGLHFINETAGGAQFSSIVVQAHLEREALLAQIAHALDAIGLVLGRRKGGKQETGQDGDNRNHHQQFDESESPARPAKCAICFPGESTIGCNHTIITAFFLGKTG
jgi:hypothetical protein